ncbi:AfsR/SARP family transcriptional regulator [Actinokineospora enzanensis]|uniref:AfsR/SARP family transcriptional regulator n=1 Tax=Actinokineospora enzanensis TaxID=155975 RepID=UPI00037772F1|nr:BTAD domain-containing putative transcriptional regulator [Actinokineospora enzanensis]
MDVRILVLGPVEIASGEFGGESHGLVGAKPRALLSALLLQARQVVPSQRLVDLLWSGAPPGSATMLLHTYVATLRQVLGGRSRIVTRAPGYLLDVDPTDSDLESFDNHLYAARHAERQIDNDAAAGLYRRALRLWRGAAFADVDVDFAQIRARSLASERLSAEEGLARCLLRTGLAADAVNRLVGLVDAHPLREHTRGLLMRALVDSGRSGEALEVYRDGRTRIRAELGVEPGAELRQLHATILSGTPRPRGRQARLARPAGEPVDAVPRHLPPDIPDFTGRAEQLQMITGRCGSDASGAVVISGPAGAGKTALAVRAAHQVRAQFPDGQLFADLRGGERGAFEMLGRFLGELGTAAGQLPADTEGRAGLFRTRIADKRLLVVLDNVRHEEQVRGLLPDTPNCLLIVTSRTRLPGLPATLPIELAPLCTSMSVRMLGNMVGTARVSDDAAAAETIATLCAGSPLAVRAAGAKLLARPHWPLRALAGRLSDERRALDDPTTYGCAIRAGLRLNYAELDDPHRRVFHLLALLDLPDFGSWTAAPLLEISLEQAEDVLERLVDLRLLEVAGIDAIGRVRYRFHDLVRDFGTEQALRDEPADAVAAAVCRLLATWMALVDAGANKLPRVTLGLRPRPRPAVDLDARLLAETESDPSGWFRSETAAVVRAVERSYELGIDEMTTTLISSLLSSPFAVRNEFDGWQRTHEVALAAARDSGDSQAEATVLTGLGQLYYEKDEFATALAFFTQAAEGAKRVGDAATKAVALVGIGTVYRDLADFRQARTHLRRAVELAEHTGEPSVRNAADYGLAASCRELGEFQSAIDRFQRCVTGYRELDDRRGEGLAIRGLGLCHRAVGEFDLAADLCDEAERILLAAGDRLGAAYAAQSVAKARIRQGRLPGVAESLDRSLTWCSTHGDRFGVALVTRTLGELSLAAGDSCTARVTLSEALARWTELGLPLWQARTLRDLAAAEVTDDPAAGVATWARARALFAQTGTREIGELAGLTPAEWLAEVRAKVAPGRTEPNTGEVVAIRGHALVGGRRSSAS